MGMDGNSAQCIAHGSTIRATPIEVFETRYPMRTVEYSLRADSGGAGKWRGGVGVRRLFEVTAPEITVSALLDRTDVGPWGFRGGQSGGPAGLFVRFAGTDEFKTFVEAFGTVSPTKFINIRMMLGDQLLMLSPGGGGYGEPAERDDAALKDDLLDGFVTSDGLDAYGRSRADITE
jgi:N-methylhydantoinase B/oxoprolinase/acetone carboxylase alpha subunit